MADEIVPHMPLEEGSEIIGDIDVSAVGLDGLFRPIFFSSEYCDGEINISVADAKRLIEFLEHAVLYLEEKMQ